MNSDCIAAISTPPGKGGVAIIRLSGGSPLGIAEKMFDPAGKVPVSKFAPRMMYAGTIKADSFSDYGLCVWFRAPHSFTGEDVVEFHCHGGTSIARGILCKALSLGCRMAERGEFTRRAFLNGKLTLASAEGLIDMINGESEAEVRAGFMLYSERLTAQARSFQEEITELLAGIDADIDFPEEDIEHTDLKDIGKEIGRIDAQLQALLSTYRTGRKIMQGVSVVLAGKPNTGKSSVLNALLGSDKAIVSSQAGTTRDVVEGTLEIEGVRFRLYDTAGIRESENEVENIGISRARSLIEGADLVLFILDASQSLSSEDREIYESLSKKKKLVVYNKTDLGEDVCDPPADIRVSAKTGDFEALRRAHAALSEAVSVCGSVPLDLLGVHLKEAWEALGEISGETANERIIDEIFAKFCVGK